MISLMFIVLVLFLAAEPLSHTLGISEQATTHLTLLMGATSLVVALLQYFVSVVTRSRGISGWHKQLPKVFFASGLLIVVLFTERVPLGYLSLAVLPVLVGLWVLYKWITEKALARKAPHHPALDWYRAAVFCLGVGLFSVLAMPYLLDWNQFLSEFHGNIILYGFMGLVIIATLQVLMPVVNDHHGTDDARLLSQDLPWVLCGVLFLSVGHAMHHVLSIVGLMFAGLPLARLMGAWVRLYRHQVISLHGVSPLLFASLLGFVISAITVDRPGMPGESSLVFLPGCLFPFLSGLAGYMVPLWVRPQAQKSALDAARERLSRWGGARAGLFLVAALTALLNPACSHVLAIVTLAWGGLQIAVWFFDAHSTRMAVRGK